MSDLFCKSHDEKTTTELEHTCAIFFIRCVLHRYNNNNNIMLK